MTIVTNAGGPGVLATDSLILSGGQLATLTSETMSALNELLPAHWSHGNPIDILGDADPDRYAKSLEIAAKDDNSDGLLVILTPQAMTDPVQTADQLRPLAKSFAKPILASWMGGVNVAPGASLLEQAGIPTFPYPDTVARVFQYMWQYSDNLRLLFETPAADKTDDEDTSYQQRVETIIQNARAAGRNLLSEWESKQILAAYSIPTVETQLARNSDEAVQHARAIGYPVVLKLHSETITHKTDVGGVLLKLNDDDAVRDAFATIQASVAERVGAEHFWE